MDGIGGTIKNVILRNVILRKVKSGQFVVHSPPEFSEPVTKFVSSIHSVYLSENENFVKPEDISMDRKINQTLKIHKQERKCSQNGNIFFKNANHEDPFQVQWFGRENEISVAMLKPVKVIMNVRNTRKVIMKVKSSYVAQYVINGIMKTVFYEKFIPPRFINRLY